MVINSDFDGKILRRQVFFSQPIRMTVLVANQPFHGMHD